MVAGNKGGIGEKAFYRKLVKRADERFSEHLDRLKG
jgi:hypothetical protein